MNVEIHITGLCLFVQPSANAPRKLWLVDAENPGSKKKSKDGKATKKTSLTRHDPMLWLEKGPKVDPGGRKPKNGSFRTHNNPGGLTKMDVFRLSNGEVLNLTLGTSGSPAPPANVVRLSAIENCGSQWKLNSNPPVAAVFEIDRGSLTPDYEEDVGGWLGSGTTSHPPTRISTCTKWSISDPQASQLTIQTSDPNQEPIIVEPNGIDPIVLWIVCWPHPPHPPNGRPHTHFKWFHELLDFGGCQPDELTHPIEPRSSPRSLRRARDPMNPPSTFCPGAQFP